jgi:hypothetical protein
MQQQRLYVYVRPRKGPIVIESNIAWALQYWRHRKHHNPNIHWEIR